MWRNVGVLPASMASRIQNDSTTSAACAAPGRQVDVAVERRRTRTPSSGLQVLLRHVACQGTGQMGVLMWFWGMVASLAHPQVFRGSAPRQDNRAEHSCWLGSHEGSVHALQRDGAGAGQPRARAGCPVVPENRVGGGNGRLQRQTAVVGGGAARAGRAWTRGPDETPPL